MAAARVWPALRAGAQVAGRAWIVERIIHRIGLLRAIFAAGVVVIVAIGFLASARPATLVAAHIGLRFIPGVI
jgi:hypothetical protein